MNSSDVVACMAVLSGNYPNLTVTDEMVLLWANAFEDDPAHHVTGALHRWIQDEEWPPTVAGVRTKMAEISRAQARELSWTSRDEPNVRYLTIAEGRAVASNAYATDCAERGVEPNWTYFDRAIGGMRR